MSAPASESRYATIELVDDNDDVVRDITKMVIRAMPHIEDALLEELADDKDEKGWD